MRTNGGTKAKINTGSTPEVAHSESQARQKVRATMSKNTLNVGDKFVGRDMVKLVAFDPGGTTGVAMCTLTRVVSTFWRPEIETFTAPWPYGAVAIRDAVLGADVVIVEEFRVRSGEALSIVGDRLWSAEVTGWITGLLETSTLPKEFLKQPPWCKEFLTPNTVDKRLGFWPTLDKRGKPTKSHEGDALLHLLYFLSR